MKKIKLFAFLLSCLSLVSAFSTTASQITYAAENISVTETADTTFSIDEVTMISSNDLYKGFMNEINSPKVQETLKNNPQSEEARNLVQSLIYKYDGAEAEFSYGIASMARGLFNTTGWSEKFVNGGINEYATTKTGLANLRDYLGACAVGLTVNGAGYGAMIGGVIGAVVGTVIGAGVLGKRCDQGQADVKLMISKGRSNGGVRMTLTEEFPICSLTSQTQCGI